MFDGISSCPRHLEGLSRLIATITSVAEVIAADKKSDIIGSEGMTDGQLALKLIYGSCKHLRLVYDLCQTCYHL